MSGNRLALDSSTCETLLAELGGEWVIKGNILCRKIRFKGYAKAVRIAVAISEMAEQEDHHPDITFGWGYCEVHYTTHSAKGLTRRDFDCARKVDWIAGEMLEGAS